MKRLGLVLGMFACVSALALSAGAPAVRAEDKDKKCGEEGQPSCPLQGWMEKEIDAALDKGDMKALAAAYEKLAGFAPDPKWNDGENGWSKLAKDGAAAATKGDAVAAKATCKSCHKAWRSKYKDSFRTKPLPK
jgi:hypothetical protein